MIFDGKLHVDIADAEIEALVTDHVSERHHLEFKATINSKDDDDKIELLRDVCSLANGGGGYLIVGIRDDGKGRAQKYEPTLLADPERIKRIIVHTCHDHIAERIDGLEVMTRTISGNPLVLVRIPPSARRPHMVTYKDRTEFYTRYQDGKRSMTVGEIREAFTKDQIGMHLSQIQAQMRQVLQQNRVQQIETLAIQRHDSGVVPQLLHIEEGRKWRLPGGCDEPQIFHYSPRDSIWI